MYTCSKPHEPIVIILHEEVNFFAGHLKIILKECNIYRYNGHTVYYEHSDKNSIFQNYSINYYSII